MVDRGNPFTSMVSCKWLVVIGILTIAISLVAGIILGVIAVHFSNATAAKESSPTPDPGEIMSASAGAQHMDLSTTILPVIDPTSTPMSPTEKHMERDLTAAPTDAFTSSVESFSSTKINATTSELGSSPLTSTETAFSATSSTIPITMSTASSMISTHPEKSTTTNTATTESLPTSTIPTTTSTTTTTATTATTATTTTTATTATTVKTTTAVTPFQLNSNSTATGDVPELKDSPRRNATLPSNIENTTATSIAPVNQASPSSSFPPLNSSTSSFMNKPINLSDLFETRPYWLQGNTTTKKITLDLLTTISPVTTTVNSSTLLATSTQNFTNSVSVIDSELNSTLPMAMELKAETTLIQPNLNSSANASSTLFTMPSIASTLITTPSIASTLINTPSTASSVNLTSFFLLLNTTTTLTPLTITNASTTTATLTSTTSTSPLNTTLSNSTVAGTLTVISTFSSVTLMNATTRVSSTSSSVTATTPITTPSANQATERTKPIEQNQSATVSTTESTAVLNSTTTTKKTAEEAAPIDNSDSKSDSSDSEVVEQQDPTHPCPGSPNTLIFSDQICDGKVQCPEATDETDCSCRSRMDPSKICDGIFDCPFLDDETSCRGCNASQFNCDITRTRPLCIPLKQRCDGLEQCPDGMDEVGCSVLSPSQEPLEVSVAKYSSGYVMHNIKNKWYPLCGLSHNATQLVSGICQLTVGDSLGMFQMSKRKANATAYNGLFVMFTEIAKKPLMVENCSELLFVQCPSPRCGRKAPSLAEIGRKVTVKSNITITTTKKPLTFQSDNANLPVKPSSNLKDKFQAFIGTSVQSDQPSMDMEVNPLLSRRLRKSGSTCQDSRCSRLSGRFPESLVQRRKRRGTLDRIVGGRESNMGAWPWVVAIIRDGIFKCGGSLIDSNWILTAGHCFHALESSHFEIQLGMLRRSSFSPMEQTRAVLSVYVHPKYDPFTLENDVTLLKVQEPFQLNQWAAPACLPSLGYTPQNDTLCTVIGWGNVQENGPESDSLREVAIPIKPCNSDLQVNPNKILCAGFPEGKKDSCQGDSGGPFVCPDPTTSGRWFLAGIVSFGLGCARPGELGAYTNVAYYINWINGIIDGKSDQPMRTPNQNCKGMICQRGTGACLSPDFICDGYVDCLNAEDEISCGSAKIFPSTSHAPIISTLVPNLTTTPLPTTSPAVCTANQFTCSKVFQCVELSDKCDQFRDCKDGTDELSCSCADVLRGNGNSQLICDDHVDCSDYSDEAGCRNCSASEYYSFVSSKCLPYKEMCDNQVQSDRGDDESHCVALIPKPFSVAVDRMGRLKRESSGVVSVNKLGLWQPICVQNWTSSVSEEICSFLGYGPGLSYSFIAGIQSTPVKASPPPQGFLWNSTKGDNSQFASPKSDMKFADETSISSALHSIVKRQSTTTNDCKFVNVTCANQQCGIRPNLGGWDNFSNIEGRFPWHATLFLNGQYLCGATLVAPEWLLVSANCVRNINLTVDYVAALLGARRLIPFTSPTEQIRRIANMVKISTTSKMALLYLDRPVQLTETVNHICLVPMDNVRALTKKNQCVAVTMNGTLLASSISFSKISITVRTLSVNWTSDETITSCPSDKWSGSVACSDGLTWYAVAIFERNCGKKGPFVDSLEGIWQHFEAIDNTIKCSSPKPKQKRKRQLQFSCPMPILSVPSCNSWRCPLGTCLELDQVCDGVPDCRDRSDETEACTPEVTTVTPFLNATKCSTTEYECFDGECIPGDMLCDGVVDCKSGEDEKGPFSDIQCPFDAFRCLGPKQNRSQEMISMSAVCDGKHNCSNGMDEQKCTSISAEFPVLIDKYGNPLNVSSSGFLVIRLQGLWFLYCANDWSANLTSATCTSFGYGKRASYNAVSSSAASLSLGKGSQCSTVVYLNCA